MEYNYLGRTGLKVSKLSLGCMNFGGFSDKEVSQEIILKAYNAGINLFDTANAYNGGRSEEILGDTLNRENIRDRVIITTKVHHPMDNTNPNASSIHRRHIIEQCEASLKRLKTDYIDVYQLHRPDPYIPIDESLRALDDLIRSGKVRYAGTSSFPSWQIMESLWVSKEYGLNRFISEQPPYNLLDRRIERELVPFSANYGIGLITWSPTARGFLTGKYKKNSSLPNNSRFNKENDYGGFFPDWIKDHMSDKSFEILDILKTIAADKKCKPIHIALAWNLSRAFISSVLIGPRTESQLDEYLKALDIKLTPKDEELINSVSTPGEHVVSYYGEPLADFSSKKHSWL